MDTFIIIKNEFVNKYVAGNVSIFLKYICYIFVNTITLEPSI